MNQAYYNGNFYQCVAATAPGESPDTAPAKWRLVRFPAEWRLTLVGLTLARLLKIDGQTDRAQVEKDEALNMERTGLNDLIRLAANAEQRRQRPNVMPGGHS